MNETTTITTVEVNNPKKKKTHKASNSYKVTDETLLYKIADAGLLYEYLHGVNKDKDGNKVFHFDRNDEIKSIVDRFNEREATQE